MSFLTLGIRVVPNQFQRIKLENINFENKIENLKDEAAKQINLPKQGIELIYCGNILDDDAKISSCGIKPGVMIHVLKKNDEKKLVPSKTLSESEVQQLVVTYRSFTMSYGYRAGLQRLSRPEILENIISSTPALSEDPVAISIIQDPELLVHLSDPDTVRRMAELHPSLIEAADRIAAVVREEANQVNPNTPGTSSGYSYSLEALSDDEEMDSSSSDGTREGQPLSRNQSQSAITAAQLAAAIATATGNIGINNSSDSSNVITSEMFSQAMHHAFSNVIPNANGGQGNNESLESMDAVLRRLSPQLEQMREIGLTNDIINVQALQATNGDVQAAIDLVFSGALNSD